ncbi:MAG: hypothetical protein E7270_06595 [Lachnospiraceae bacterium]|nr:hypothetical protein [Lachnospiraceae bacterium]
MDFLLFTVLGITKDNATNDFELAKFACINRAYLDAARRVLKTNNNEIIRNIGTEYLMDSIKKDNINSAQKVINELNSTLNSTENEIDKEVSIGIIQKWVNMTYKYMIMLYDIIDCDNDMISKLLEAYDVPLDSTILKAVGIKNKAWSKINDVNAYNKTQAILRELAENNSANCFNWENSTWVEERGKEKDSVYNKYKMYRDNQKK